MYVVTSRHFILTSIQKATCNHMCADYNNIK